MEALEFSHKGFDGGHLFLSRKNLAKTSSRKHEKWGTGSHGRGGIRTDIGSRKYVEDSLQLGRNESQE